MRGWGTALVTAGLVAGSPPAACRASRGRGRPGPGRHPGTGRPGSFQRVPGQACDGHDEDGRHRQLHVRAIHFGCVTDGNPVKIKYRYSGNISDGIPGNFEAELDDSTGVEVGNDNIVNDIAASGSKTTNLYLDPDVDTPPFHLHVDAEPGGHWSLTFTCDKGQ